MMAPAWKTALIPVLGIGVAGLVFLLWNRPGTHDAISGDSKKHSAALEEGAVPRPLASSSSGVEAGLTTAPEPGSTGDLETAANIQHFIQNSNPAERSSLLRALISQSLPPVAAATLFDELPTLPMSESMQVYAEMADIPGHPFSEASTAILEAHYPSPPSGRHWAEWPRLQNAIESTGSGEPAG